MTEDEIIEMAKQAWADAGDAWVAKEWFDDRAKAFEAFAKLVAAKEREECAKAADEWSKRQDDVGGYIARNIRARGEQA
jgi:ABC-type taurine transport system substrate-binding protein